MRTKPMGLSAVYIVFWGFVIRPRDDRPCALYFYMLPAGSRPLFVSPNSLFHVFLSRRLETGPFFLHAANYRSATLQCRLFVDSHTRGVVLLATTESAPYANVLTCGYPRVPQIA